MVFSSFMHNFSPRNKLKTSILFFTVVGSFTLNSPTLVKVNKATKSGTLLSKIARCTKPHLVKSTDLHCILNTNINKCRGEKPIRRGKTARSSPRQCIPATTPAQSRRWNQSWTNLVIRLQAFCAPSNLFWYEI